MRACAHPMGGIRSSFEKTLFNPKAISVRKRAFDCLFRREIELLENAIFSAKSRRGLVHVGESDSAHKLRKDLVTDGSAKDEQLAIVRRTIPSGLNLHKRLPPTERRRLNNVLVPEEIDGLRSRREE
jgi:hypothetical protein